MRIDTEANIANNHMNNVYEKPEQNNSQAKICTNNTSVEKSDGVIRESEETDETKKTTEEEKYAENENQLPQSKKLEIVKNIQDIINYENSSDEIISEIISQTKAFLGSLSSNELEQLSSMQLNITSSNIKYVMGVVAAMREKESAVNTATAVIGVNSGAKGQVTKEDIEKAVEATGINNISGAVEKIQYTLNISRENQNISYDEMDYILKNNLDLSVNNIYKAKYSCAQAASNSNQNSNVSQVEWDKLKPQVEKIIDISGLTVDDATLEAGKFLVDRDLPVNTNNLKKYQVIKEINQEGFNEENIVSNAITNIIKGEEPLDANVYYGDVNKQAQELVSKVNNISNEAIKITVQSRKPVTIYNLHKTQEGIENNREKIEINSEKVYDSSDKSDLETQNIEANFVNTEINLSKTGTSIDINVIKTQRQLEEIRLRLTTDAGAKLLTKDMNLDTKELSKVVESLKEIENQYYKEQLSNSQVESGKENVSILSDTLNKIRELSDMPAYSLGKIAYKTDSVTLDEVYYESASYRENLQAANEAYDTMMTKPRMDMGDSINRAFDNMYSLMEELGIEVNEANKRAVRILGYNQMEITEENMAAVKNASAMVNNLLETLKPQTVIELIRDNVNPLNTPIEELSDEISQRQAQGGQLEEDYSKFLYELDKNKEITADERKSFIGIYRLLNTVTNSKGKDIGQVIKNGQEVTLNNLLSASKSMKAKGLDINVDENFGQLEETEQKGERILDQINTAYNTELSKEILRDVTPEILKTVSQNNHIENMTVEELNQAVKNTERENTSNKEYMDQQIEAFKELLDSGDEGEGLIKELKLPLTMDNLTTANLLTNRRGSIFKKLQEDIDGASDNEEINSAFDSIFDGFVNDREDQEIYNKAQNQVESQINEMELTGNITSKEISALKQFNLGINMLKSMTRNKQYQIPVKINEEITVINLSVVENEENTGVINAAINSDLFGKTSARLKVSEEKISGYIISDNEEMNKALKENVEYIGSLFDEIGLKGEIIAGEESKEISWKDSSEKIETKTLYEAAKTLVKAIKTMNMGKNNK